MTLARALSSALLLLVLCCEIGIAQETTQPVKPKLARDVFKNVQVLRDLPEDQFWATMSFFADSLGVNCERCHADPFEADKKTEKVKARQMIRMVLDLNARYFDGAQKVTCNSCHRGTTAPIAEPSLDAQRWMDFTRAEGPLPDAAGLIARYQKLTGAAAPATPQVERVSYEMTIYLSEAPPRKVNTEVTIGGPHRFRMSTRSDHGLEEWIRDEASGWIKGAHGWEAVEGNKMFDASSEASSFDWETLKEHR